MRIGVLMIGAALLAAVTACGGSSPATKPADPLAGLTADQIAAKAQSYMLARPAMRFTGTVSGSGATNILDLVVEENTGCIGTVEIPGRGTFEFVALHSRAWIKPDMTFWEKNAYLPPTLARIYTGKYVPATGSYASYDQNVHLCGLTNEATGSTAGLRKLGTANIDGQRTVVLENPDKTKAYVTDTAKPVIIRVTGPTAADGYITIALLPTAPVITAPPANLTLRAS